jgi:hypothetical protein
LSNAFDAYEQPAMVAPAASTSSLFYSKQGGMDFPLLLAACRRGSSVGFPPTMFHTICQ